MSGKDDMDMEYELNDKVFAGKGSRKHKYQSGSSFFKIRTRPNEKMELKFGGYVNRWDCEDFPGLGSKNPGIWERAFTSHDSLPLIILQRRWGPGLMRIQQLRQE